MGNFRPLSQTKYINDANLVSYWPLDGNSNDYKTTNNGTDTAMSYSAGKFGSAGDFNGSSSKITVGSIVNGTTDLTICLWIKTTTAGQVILAKRATGTGNGIFNLNMNAGKLNFWDYNGSAFQFSPSTTATTAFNDGNWRFIVFTRVGTAGKYYLDGKLDGTTTAASTLSWNTDAITIGQGGAGDPTVFFTGSQDDLAIFNRALSAAEVADLYQSMTLGEYNGAGSGITKGLWHLNGSSVDSSGNNNNGTDTAVTYSQANGKFGVGAGFTRASSSNITWSTASPDITPAGRTISAWFNLASLPANEEYYFINSLSKYATGLVYYNNGGTRKAFLYHTDSGGSPAASIPSTGETLSTGVWYNLIGVYNGTTVKSYLNGVEIHSQNISSTYSSGTGDSSIGKWTGAAHYFNGAIDEVIIENVAWSAEKVKKYYTYSKGRFGL